MIPVSFPVRISQISLVAHVVTRLEVNRNDEGISTRETDEIWVYFRITVSFHSQIVFIYIIIVIYFDIFRVAIAFELTNKCCQIFDFMK